MTPVGSFVEVTHRYKNGTETTFNWLTTEPPDRVQTRNDKNVTITAVPAYIQTT